MDIGAAIRLLCDVHTRDQSEVGFEVMIGAAPYRSTFHSELYTEAWATLRRAVDLPTEPEIPRDTDSRLTENNILR